MVAPVDIGNTRDGFRCLSVATVTEPDCRSGSARYIFLMLFLFTEDTVPVFEYHTRTVMQCWSFLELIDSERVDSSISYR